MLLKNSEKEETLLKYPLEWDPRLTQQISKLWQKWDAIPYALFCCPLNMLECTLYV